MLNMPSTIRTKFSKIYRNMSNYIKTNMDFLVEVSIVALFFGALLNKYFILH